MGENAGSRWLVDELARPVSSPPLIDADQWQNSQQGAC